MTGMDDLSTQHLDWLQRQNDRSPQTIQARARVLRAVETAGTITREQLETWFESRVHLSTSTRAADRSHLRGFYEWAQAYDHRTDNPMARVRGVRVNNRILKKASKTQMETLLLRRPRPRHPPRFPPRSRPTGGRIRRPRLGRCGRRRQHHHRPRRQRRHIPVIDVSLLLDWLGERHNGNVVSGGRKVYGPTFSSAA